MVRREPGMGSQASGRNTLRSRARSAGSLALLLGLTVLGACAKDAPQDYTAPEGPIAKEVDHLFKELSYIAVIPLGLFVFAWMFVAVAKFRAKEGAPQPLRVPRPTRVWLILGPTLFLMVLDLLPMVKEIPLNFALAEEPEEALEVNVYGHMWWWEYEYVDEKVITAHELYIPTGRKVLLRLHSIEPGLPAPEGMEFHPGVIHSFWIPKLAGKTDVVPGRTNHMLLEADEPGKWIGQCTEYCNLSHANMRAAAVALEPADFDAWIEEQKSAAAKPTSGAAKAGFDLFTGKGGCVACHAMQGVEGATARVGPNLTHLKAREKFGGYVFPNTKENLTSWVTDAGAMKPMRPEKGTGMPTLGKSVDGKPPVLTPEEVDQVVAFLETLK